MPDVSAMDGLNRGTTLPLTHIGAALGGTVISTPAELNRYAPDVLHNKAASAAQAGRLVEAKAMLREALALSPKNVSVLVDIARVCADRKDHDTAILMTRRALRLAPEEPNALMLLAESLRQTDRFAEALHYYTRLKAVAPQTTMLDHCMAIALTALHRYDEAGQHFRAATLRSEHAVLTKWEYSHFLLRLGNWADGWDGYASRFEAGEFSNVRRYDFGVPDWNGEPLDGKTIFIHAEQGLGDQLMFASIIPELQREGANVILACAFELVDVLTDSFPTVPVYGILRQEDSDRWIGSLPPVDYQIPIGNLAVIRRRTDESYTREAYVKTNPERVARQAQYLDDVIPGWQNRERYPLRVGLMWASNPALFDWHAARRGRRKTIPADLLGRLGAIDDALFVSVQSRQSGNQAAHVPFMDIIDCSESLNTLADTAALIESLDVVVTVDTSVAHLAGAMGKPTLLMLAQDADWRWLIDRSDSIWYEHMTLLRQEHEGDWSGVVDQVGQHLRRMLHRANEIPVFRGESEAPKAKTSSKRARSLHNAK